MNRYGFLAGAKRQWGESIIKAWMPRCDAAATDIAVTVGGRDETGAGPLFESFDPSRPGVVVLDTIKLMPRS